MSFFLSLETSIRGFAAGIYDHSKDSWIWSFVNDERNASNLGGQINVGLQECEVDLKEIVAISVGVGPGSFTGIKVGLAFCYGWLHANPQLHVTGIKTLDCLSTINSPIVLPITKTHAYLSLGGQSRLVELQDHTNWINQTTRLIGDWEPLEEIALREEFDINKISYLAANHAALEVHQEQIKQGWPSMFSATWPKPNYLRLSTAEEKLGKSVSWESLS